MSLKFFSEYLLLEKKYSNHTVLAYTKDIENFQTFLNQHNYPEDLIQVGYSEIRQWIVTLVDAGISNRTINRKVSSLNTYYKYLQKTEDINVNPLKQHKALKVGKKAQLPFSEQELKTVLENSIVVDDFESARNHFIIELFYATGIRRIELVNLKLTDVDKSNNQIKVLGKRKKERYIPLIESLSKSLNSYLEYRNNLPTIDDKEYLFLTKSGLKIYEKLVYRIINKYFSEASTKAKCSPHVIRHSFATHLLNQGADLNTVKELLGHTSLAATQVYTHNSIAELKKVHAKSHPRNQS
ncbi:integrase/recombinase XerC [Winogradskyella eximia]|jgi:integrase/recombinase XerC|uniref:Integrase/recombinase XerC n=1 Tax=Winogradskyella eximia TaxID=262006 RepID=A0A3D9HD36_9FLAO|nr:tyrosine-type recombinase/integrase [Winogradskyella eximia]RED47360.1 integrase/recombinase XerC [Winogradskyella eximia]|tara:strand:+ start:5365 stop:6255 length:891 start_codon:yes stop_codon:yes gene_type:complete